MRAVLLAALSTALVLSQDRAPVFLDTGDLETLLNMRSYQDIKVFDCTVADNSLLSYH